MDVDPRLTLAQYQLLYSAPSGPPDRFVATALGATTKGDLTAFTVYTPFGPNRDEGRALVRDLRDPAGPLAPPAGVSVLVGGGAADVDDVVSRVWADFPRTALFIVVTTFLVLFVLLRSVVLPIKALAMNTLSIVASFGALVWIFQDGNLSQLLGFQPLGFVETTQPVILFCVLFGLSMDYEVFLLSRMKEVWDRTGDNTEAVARGLERSGASSARRRSSSSSSPARSRSPTSCSSRRSGWASRSPWRSTRPSCGRCWSRRRCGCWEVELVGAETARRALQPILPRTEAEVEAAVR